MQMDRPSYRDARMHLKSAWESREGGGGEKRSCREEAESKETSVSTGPLARPFARLLIRSLAPLTGLLAPDCSLCSGPLLRSLVCSLAHFAHSLARGTVNDWMAILSVFFSTFESHTQYHSQ